MLERYDSVIINSDPLKNKMCSLKFEIVDGKLFAYNSFLKEEHRKLLQVNKINNVDIRSFIDKIDVNDLYIIDEMIKFGIDTTKEFVCELSDGKNNIQYDILSPDSRNDIFYKDHDINDNISGLLIPNFTSVSAENNIMLEYASSNVKGLLSMLRDISVSVDDKCKFDKIIQRFIESDDIYNNISNNLDMLFLSTQLLLLDEKLDLIPSIVSIQNPVNKAFYVNLNNAIESNNAILTENKLDYKKVIKMIRNCIAHSNYKILDNGMVEFYNDGKHNMNFVLHKNIVISIFNQLYNYYFLQGVFPIIYENKHFIGRSPFEKQELINYLKNIELIGHEKIVIKQWESEEEQMRMDDALTLSLMQLKSIKSKDEIFRFFDSEIKNYLSFPNNLDVKKISDNDIEYILNNINELGENYFYELSRTSQLKVVHQLIQKKYNKNYYLQNNLENIINSNYFDNESLTKDPSLYINFKSKLEIMIMSLLNNLLLFCYNQNKRSIVADYLRFPISVYKDYLDSKVRNFYDLSKESSEYSVSYDSILKVLEVSSINKEELKKIEKQLSDKKNNIIKVKNDIENVNSIIEGTAIEEKYKMVNIEILNRIRDSLAHGRLEVEISDIKNIKNANIQIYDEYKGKVMFDTSISFGNLLEVITEPNFIKSMLLDNQNFQKHGK